MKSKTWERPEVSANGAPPDTVSRALFEKGRLLEVTKIGSQSSASFSGLFWISIRRLGNQFKAISQDSQEESKFYICASDNLELMLSYFVDLNWARAVEKLFGATYVSDEQARSIFHNCVMVRT